jgi:hypothetical protein
MTDAASVLRLRRRQPHRCESLKTSTLQAPVSFPHQAVAHNGAHNTRFLGHLVLHYRKHQHRISAYLTLTF